MRFALIFVLLILSAAKVASQAVVYGRVVDAKTSKPLPFADVYIDNTTTGTTCDKDGNYSLSLPIGTSEIIFSFVGYISSKSGVVLYNGEKRLLDMKIAPAEQLLTSVDVKAESDKEWEKNFKRFKRVFIGETLNSWKTKIINYGDIDLAVTKEKKKTVLNASATKPLRIENLALGYILIYDMTAFTSTSDRYQFTGHVFFKEMKPESEKQAALWGANRLETYTGSVRHLLKSVVDNRVEEEGFLLYCFRPEMQGLRVNRTVVFADDLKKILMPYHPGGMFVKGVLAGTYNVALQPQVEVHYIRRAARIPIYRDVASVVGGLITRAPLKVTSGGAVVNQSAFETIGYLGEARVADLLPFDYVPGNMPQLARGEETFADLKPMRKHERLYLQTDRGYYHHGDVIWFRGFVKYNSPELRDSLSKVAYVDLIGPDKKILFSKMLPIDSGRIVGDFIIPQGLPNGNFYLRAYTQWMRNYPEREQFVKAIPVIGPLALVNGPDEIQYINNARPGNVKAAEFMPDKKQYAAAGKINVGFQLVDENDTPVSADLSVSVTDLSQAKAIAGEPTIISQFGYGPDSVIASKKQFDIQHGISFTGDFKTPGNKPKKVRIKIIQGAMEDMTETTTDESGRFHVNGFYFMDSSALAFGAFNDKAKPQFGRINVVPDECAPVPEVLPSLSLQLIASKEPYHAVRAFAMGDAVLLKEIQVTKSAIKDKPSGESIFKSVADFVVTSEALQATGNPDIIQALQSKIPGMQYFDGHLRMGPQSTFIKPADKDHPGDPPSATEPLVLVDNVAANQDPVTAADAIQQLNFSMIAKVEVFRYGNSAIFGARGANGVISITTRKGVKPTSASGFDESLFQRIVVKGFSRIEEFVAPDYERMGAEFAREDHRTTLYWNPGLKYNAQSGGFSFSFFAAGTASTYRIVIEGLTSSGEPIHEETTVVVESK